MRMKQRKILLLLFVPFVLAGLIYLFVRMLSRKTLAAAPSAQVTPPITTTVVLPGQTIKSKIISLLTQAGYPLDTAKYFVAVSAFETAGWTSQVLKDSNNLFSLIVPNSKRLSYGEGQTIFASYDDAINGLVKYVLKPFKYPANYGTLRDLTDFMKSKGYYGIDSVTYYNGVAVWYNKLYPNG